MLDYLLITIAYVLVIVQTQGTQVLNICYSMLKGTVADSEGISLVTCMEPLF